MDIFRPMNLLTEMEDWLSMNQIKLGHFSYIKASRERWFQFEIASLILKNWERILRVPWNKYHVWVETEKVDLVIAPETDKNKSRSSIDWKRGGIIEVKTGSFQLAEEGALKLGPVKQFIKKIKEDFTKRKKVFDFKEMIAVTLCHHPIDDKFKDREFSELIKYIEDNLQQLVDIMRSADYELPNKSGRIPYIRSSFRGVSYGFYSCGVWIQT